MTLVFHIVNYPAMQEVLPTLPSDSKRNALLYPVDPVPTLSELVLGFHSLYIEINWPWGVATEVSGSVEGS